MGGLTKRAETRPRLLFAWTMLVPVKAVLHWRMTRSFATYNLVEQGTVSVHCTASVSTTSSQSDFDKRWLKTIVSASQTNREYNGPLAFRCFVTLIVVCFSPRQHPRRRGYTWTRRARARVCECTAMLSHSNVVCVLFVKNVVC